MSGPGAVVVDAGSLRHRIQMRSHHDGAVARPPVSARMLKDVSAVTVAFTKVHADVVQPGEFGAGGEACADHGDSGLRERVQGAAEQGKALVPRVDIALVEDDAPLPRPRRRCPP